MNKRIIYLLFLIIPALASGCRTTGGNENTSVLLRTTFGDIKVRLYDKTPLHRDNFIKLVRSGFYDGISFHRVINNFMIQAGDPSTRTVPVAATDDSLYTYTIPAEFEPEYFHKKGALAAAREGNDINPEMRSSGTQFYIVQGIKYTDDALDLTEQRINNSIKQAVFSKYIKEVTDSANLSGASLTEPEIQAKATAKMYRYLTTVADYKIPEDHRDVYETIGGVPYLDETYTVFGEVTEGLDVVDKIAAVKTDAADKPLTDVKILKARIVR